MPDVISYPFYFIILIGVLVFVHEGGHFVFAKLFKVKVHVFSIGFGPRLFGFTKGETEYKISAIPIGGYVKMLGEDPGEEILQSDHGRSFTDKPLWQRFIIIAAGPVTNLIFPFFLYFFIALSNGQLLPSEVGTVLPESSADSAGLKAGDVIVAVDDDTVLTFEKMVSLVAPNPNKKMVFEVLRDGKIIKKQITPKAIVVPKVPNIPPLKNEKETIGQIGVAPYYKRSLIGINDPLSIAATSGLKTFDNIIAVGNKSAGRYVLLEKEILANVGKDVTLTVKRLKSDLDSFFPKLQKIDDEKKEPALAVKEKTQTQIAEESNPFLKDKLYIRISVPKNLTSLSDLGISHYSGYVVYVRPGSNTEEIGLLRGDKVIAINGKENAISKIQEVIYNNPQKEHSLTWIHDGKKITKNFKANYIPVGIAKDLGVGQDIIDPGFEVQIRVKQWVPILVKRIDNPYLFASSFRESFRETKYGFRVVALGLKALFQGNVSFKSMGGPIMIGKMAGMAGQAGTKSFLWLMALISLNLGLLNLLPIPVLDGGQIFLIGVEAVTRRPISSKIKERIMIVGLALLLTLMLWVTVWDIVRQFVGGL